jgi:hypothetical protein
MKTEPSPHVITRVCRAHCDALAPVMFQFVQELRAQKEKGLASGIDEKRFYKLAAGLYDDLLHGGEDTRESQVRVTLTVEEARVLLTVQMLPLKNETMNLREKRYELRSDDGMSPDNDSRLAAP